MDEIGRSLREARMRARIDISEVEAETKIRAKYLRALENEEWDLLPGPTFVKTFLRTYAEYLGLDATLLVEGYKERYERPSSGDLAPIAPRLAGHRQRRRASIPPPLAVGGLVVVAVVAALALLGLVTGDDAPVAGDGAATRTQEQARRTTAQRSRAAAAVEEDRRARRRAERRRGQVVRLRVVPTAAVWICLQDQSGKRLIGGRVVQPDEPRRTYRGRRLRIRLGSGAAVLRVEGRSFDVPDRSVPISYELTPGGRRDLGGSGPTCS